MDNSNQMDLGQYQEYIRHQEHIRQEHIRYQEFVKQQQEAVKNEFIQMIDWKIKEVLDFQKEYYIRALNDKEAELSFRLSIELQSRIDYEISTLENRLRKEYDEKFKKHGEFYEKTINDFLETIYKREKNITEDFNLKLNEQAELYQNKVNNILELVIERENNLMSNFNIEMKKIRDELNYHYMFLTKNNSIISPNINRIVPNTYDLTTSQQQIDAYNLQFFHQMQIQNQNLYLQLQSLQKTGNTNGKNIGKQKTNKKNSQISVSPPPPTIKPPINYPLPVINSSPPPATKPPTSINVNGINGIDETEESIQQTVNPVLEGIKLNYLASEFVPKVFENK